MPHDLHIASGAAFLPLVSDPDVARMALEGLLAPRKTLQPSLFYDEEGCRLFYAITKLPEYYLTRTEFRLLETVAPEVAGLFCPGFSPPGLFPIGFPPPGLFPIGATLVEYGASDETKAAMLLRQTAAGGETVFRSYVPIDVAAPALRALRERMRARHPAIAVSPVTADFMRPVTLPARDAESAVLGFFPGSTIGNLEPDAAIGFLRRARLTLGMGARFLLGFDMCRDPARLIPAYDDAQGVTAAFNLNLLTRLNREAGADFDLAAFRHEARWNAAGSRIEMHLVSRAAQTVAVAGETVRFARDESIHTENSHKYAPERMRAMIEAAGWSRQRAWSDPEGLFALWLLG